MGQLSCNRCGATAEADTQEDADVLIDHALGQKIGRPCSGKQSDLVWSSVTRGTVVKHDSHTSDTTESDSPTIKPKKSKRR